MIPEALADLHTAIEETDFNPVFGIAASIVEAMTHDKKLMICGCGGSAAQAQHFAAELTWAFEEEHALPALALTTDTSFLTAISNDYAFSEAFRRQVEALGQKGDVLCCISTSGQSQVVFKAALVAKSIGIEVVALTGRGGLLTTLADQSVRVNSCKTSRIQEVHQFIIHLICERIENDLRNLQPLRT